MFCSCSITPYPAVVGTLGFLAFLRWILSYRLLWFAGYEDMTIYTESISILSNISGGKGQVVKFWQESWESIDNRRIFMHGVTYQGDLNARQICAVESSAKHNPNRSVQIYLKITSDYELSNPANTMWYTILKHYPNSNVIFFNETNYFKNTALNNWYKSKEWEKNPRKSENLSEFSRIVSLFRGGGLFIDIDTVITLKPLNGPKWWNFFVKSSLTHTFHDPTHITGSEIFHLYYGHPLSDEVICNMGHNSYNPFIPACQILNRAIHQSIANICSHKKNKKQINHCKDIKLLNRRDVFIPQFESTFWRPLKEAMKQTITQGERNENEKLQYMIRKIVDASAAPLITWDTLNTAIHKKIYSILLPNHCPLTVKYFTSLMF